MFKPKWCFLLVVGCAFAISSTVRSETATGTILDTVQDPAVGAAVDAAPGSTTYPLKIAAPIVSDAGAITPLIASAGITQSAGGHTLAVRSDGTLMAWGSGN